MSRAANAGQSTPTFNAQRCFLEADRFAKAAYTLASKFTGLSDHPDYQGKEPFLPIVLYDGKQHLVMGFSPDREGTPHDMDYLGPYVVNGALAVELYLKCLCALSVGAASVRRVHKLNELYLQLSTSCRRRLSDRFEGVLVPADMYMNIAAQLRAHVNDFRWDIDYVLTNSASSFVEYRYAHDSRLGWFVGYREVRLAVRAEILSIDPSLASYGKPGLVTP